MTTGSTPSRPGSPTEPVTDTEVRLRVNGAEIVRRVPVRRLLVDLLRDDLGLTGTHVGCEQGQCGACTVVVDGLPARSCTLLAVQVQGTAVTTVEGLDAHPGATAMRASFTEHHALQCGFCTPGILCTLACADPGERPDDAAVREVLAGNLCRCTGYQHIVDAVLAAWRTDDASPHPEPNQELP